MGVLAKKKKNWEVITSRLLLIKETPYLKLRNLELFHAWEDAGSGLTEIIP